MLYLLFQEGCSGGTDERCGPRITTNSETGNCCPSAGEEYMMTA